MLTYGSTNCALDLSSNGKRSGFIDTQHSDNALAFSVIRTPIGVIAGSDGPTILLTAGSHGDEYEGQIILNRLMAALSPEQMSGRLIMIPALNTPAVDAKSRISPLDQGNMNRSFPGGEYMGPTKAMAGFVHQYLIPMADIVLDFHSGGTTTQYVDCAFLCVGESKSLNQRNLELAKCFGAPFTVVCPIDGTGGDFDTAAHQQDTPFLSCELGGMGTLCQASLECGWQGCLRILLHANIISSEVFKGLGGNAKPEKTVFIDIAAGSSFITSARHGLAHMQLELGQYVKKGDVGAISFDTHNFGQQVETLHTQQSGYVAIKRRNPIVAPGDHIFLICNVLTSVDYV